MATPTPAVLARIPMLKDRLTKSASKYVLTKRFGLIDRTALAHMIEIGEAEIFETPQGRAYRLKEAPEKKETQA